MPKEARKPKKFSSSGVKTRQQLKKESENKKEKGCPQFEDLDSDNSFERAKSQRKKHDLSQNSQDLERQESPTPPQFQMSPTHLSQFQSFLSGVTNLI